MSRIIVMARNEVGVIADISRVLADNHINIETISAEALDDKGTITLTADDHDGRAARSDQRRVQDRHRRLAAGQSAGRARGSREGG